MTSYQDIVNLIEKALRKIYKRPNGLIPLHAPFFKGNEWKYVKDCIDTGWVSSVGDYVNKFEEEICKFTGAKYAIATVNGTSALHIALILSGVEEGDEVLCPAFSFVATVSSILYCQANPVFIDCDSITLGMDVYKVKSFLNENCIKKKDGFTYNKNTRRRISACIPMHAYGFPVDIEPLLKLCKEYNIALTEDSAEALGSVYKNKHCGTFGQFGILSFNGNKVITTGGGGIILTNNASLANRAKHLTTTAKINHPWEYIHDDIGYNYRMPNLNAALGCAQMEYIKEILAQKKAQFEELKNELNRHDEIKVLDTRIGKGNYWLNIIEINPKYRDKILKELNQRGIQARASWYPICDMEPYKRYEQYNISVARKLSSSLICLPNGLLKN